MKKISTTKFKRMMMVFLYMVAPTTIMPLTACDNFPKMSKEDELRESYRKDGYYNRYPMQIYIDESFSKYNQNLIKTSMIELDNAFDGIKFEYLEKPASFKYSEYSYIDIKFDKDGKLDTLKAYENFSSERRLAFATIPKEKSSPHLSSVKTFTSTVTLGSYFTISEDIPSNNKWMGLELKWNNYKKFGAYVDSGVFKDDKYWDFDTTYNQFKKNIENALKGLTKHEAVHSLGFAGNEKIGCSSIACHTTDKTSLMYPYIIPDGAVRKNKITTDVIDFINKKYPKEKEMGQ